MSEDIIQPMFVDMCFKSNLKGLITNNQEIASRCYQIKQRFDGRSWDHCDTYSSLKSYDLRQDLFFKSLIDVCTNKVTAFSKEYGVDCRNVQCIEAWFNIALSGQHQEFHIHPQSHFSVVYYVSVDDHSGNIILKSIQASNDMFPLPVSNQNLTSGTCSFKPVNQDLLIFRSNIPHMVEINRSNSDRISISMNFIITN